MPSPICAFYHRPIHTKRFGFGRIFGQFRPRWRCPRCGRLYFR